MIGAGKDFIPIAEADAVAIRRRINGVGGDYPDGLFEFVEDKGARVKFAHWREAEWAGNGGVKGEHFAPTCRPTEI